VSDNDAEELLPAADGGDHRTGQAFQGQRTGQADQDPATLSVWPRCTGYPCQIACRQLYPSRADRTLGFHPELARRMCREAGFSCFTVHDFQDPADLYHEARPEPGDRGPGAFHLGVYTSRRQRVFQWARYPLQPSRYGDD